MVRRLRRFGAILLALSLFCVRAGALTLPESGLETEARFRADPGSPTEFLGAVLNSFCILTTGDLTAGHPVAGGK